MKLKKSSKGRKSGGKKMNILDLNSNQKETILLIHPMLSSAQGMKSLIADQMGQEFRYGGVNL